jgi:hypothetical protein
MATHAGCMWWLHEMYAHDACTHVPCTIAYKEIKPNMKCMVAQGNHMTCLLSTKIHHSNVVAIISQMNGSLCDHTQKKKHHNRLSIA